MSTSLRALWLAWGAVVALLAYPAGAQIIGQQSGTMGGDSGFLRPATGPSASLAIDAMPYARTVTCGEYVEVTGTATGGGAVSWSASPSGDSGSCTGTDSWACLVGVSPDDVGEGVETITITNGGASDDVTIGFYVAGAHSCFLAQDIDGTYNSTLANLDAVATWSNSGTSGLDVSQATALNQPTFRTGIVGGQPIVRCDGGDRLLASTAADWNFLHNGTDVTVASIVLRSSTAANSVVWTNKSGTSNTLLGARYYLINTNSTSIYNIGQGSAVFSVTGANNSAPINVFNSLVTTTDDDGGAGADGFLYSNGTLASSTAGVAYGAGTASALSLCSEAGGFTQPLTGDLFRVVIYQSALTSTQRGINKAVDEWALGGTLPVTP